MVGIEVNFALPVLFLFLLKNLLQVKCTTVETAKIWAKGCFLTNTINIYSIHLAPFQCTYFECNKKRGTLEMQLQRKTGL